jgi:hypothetical protein
MKAVKVNPDVSDSGQRPVGPICIPPLAVGVGTVVVRVDVRALGWRVAVVPHGGSHRLEPLLHRLEHGGVLGRQVVPLARVKTHVEEAAALATLELRRRVAVVAIVIRRPSDGRAPCVITLRASHQLPVSHDERRRRDGQLGARAGPIRAAEHGPQIESINGG